MSSKQPPPGTIEGTRTYQIECNRNSSIIDSTAPQSQNGKWTSQCEFNLKRGDRVAVSALMIEAKGAGSSTQTIEFQNDNIRKGGESQPYVDNDIVLEFGFYIVNNQRCLNLPFQNTCNTRGNFGQQGGVPNTGRDSVWGAGINLKVNQGTWSPDAATALAANPGVPLATDKCPEGFQFPGCCSMWGPQNANNLMPTAAVDQANVFNTGYNFPLQGILPGWQNATAYCVAGYIVDINAPSIPNVIPNTTIYGIELACAADAPIPGGALPVEYPVETIPLTYGFDLSGRNIPFVQGTSVIINNTNVVGATNFVFFGPIASVNDYSFANNWGQNYAVQDRVFMFFASYNETSQAMIGGGANKPMIISTCNASQINPPPLTLEAPGYYGYSANPTNFIPGTQTTYRRGARMGIGLYNGSAPWSYYKDNPTTAPYVLPNNVRQQNGMFNHKSYLRGGAFLWDQVRNIFRDSRFGVPEHGSAGGVNDLTAGGAVGGWANGEPALIQTAAGQFFPSVDMINQPFNMRQFANCDLRNYMDNQPYILVAPWYMGPQPTPNGRTLCPKLQPMRAFVRIKIDNAYENVNNLATIFTEAFHAINPLITDVGQRVQEAVYKAEYPFSKPNNVYPLISRGFFPEYRASYVAPPPTGDGWFPDWIGPRAAMFERASPLWIGNLVKCIPANFTSGINWRFQAKAPYFYHPKANKDYLKIGQDGDWQWNNLIYGNMAVRNYRKAHAGDRFIRCRCWDGNTSTHPHRDIPRPVIMNTQLIHNTVQIENPFNVTTGTLPYFRFVDTELNRFQLIFTNIDYTDENLDIIEEAFRYNEEYMINAPEAIDGREAQMAQPWWQYELDLGMSDNSQLMRGNLNALGLMTPIHTNWQREPPLSAQVGTPNPNDWRDFINVLSPGPGIQVPYGLAITPSQSYPGLGGEINIKNARQCGRVKVFSRWFKEWTSGSRDKCLNPFESNGEDGIYLPYCSLEYQLFGAIQAHCNPYLSVPSPFGPAQYEAYNWRHSVQPSIDRNISAIPYDYIDEDGFSRKLTAFPASRAYKAVPPEYGYTTNSGTATWELSRFAWGDFVGFSPGYGYDAPAVVPVNPDIVADPCPINTMNLLPGSTYPPNIPPSIQYPANNINYIWVGANDAAMKFNADKNRFELNGLYTSSLLNSVNSTPPSGTATDLKVDEAQVGEAIASLNTKWADGYPFYPPNNGFKFPATAAANQDYDGGSALPKYEQYQYKNQGVQDAQCGVFLNNIYLCRKGWEPPAGLNPQNLFGPQAGVNKSGPPHIYGTAAAETPAGSQQMREYYTTYYNESEANETAFLEQLIPCTEDNFEGTLLQKMGFELSQLLPYAGKQTNRYSQYTYNRDDKATMYEGVKPLILNSQTETSLDLYTGVLTYRADIGMPTTWNTAGGGNGTALYHNGLLNNNQINLGIDGSAVLTAQNIPQLFSCPYFIVYSDIAPTSFQSGRFKQECIYFGMKNYGSSQFFYVFQSEYDILIDSDRTLSSITTEIRNPLTQNLATLGPNSCVIYKITRNITLPPPELPAGDTEPDLNLDDRVQTDAELSQTIPGIAIGGGVAGRGRGGGGVGPPIIPPPGAFQAFEDLIVPGGGAGGPPDGIPIPFDAGMFPFIFEEGQFDDAEEGANADEGGWAEEKGEPLQEQEEAQLVGPDYTGSTAIPLLRQPIEMPQAQIEPQLVGPELISTDAAERAQRRERFVAAREPQLPHYIPKGIEKRLSMAFRTQRGPQNTPVHTPEEINRSGIAGFEKQATGKGELKVPQKLQEEYQQRVAQQSASTPYRKRQAAEAKVEEAKERRFSKVQQEARERIARQYRRYDKRMGGERTPIEERQRLRRQKSAERYVESKLGGPERRRAK